MSANSLLASHPMVRLEGNLRQRAVQRRFGSWLASGDEPWSLSLFEFVDQPPFKYFNDDHVQSLLNFCEGSLSETIATLRILGRELTHAIHALITRSPSWGREHLPSLNSPRDYAEFEQVWFPEYQRYAEHAFNHLINLPLGVLERSRQQQYCDQTLTNRVRLLGQLGFPDLVKGFRGPVRNAISHGNTEFTVAAIRFIDRTGTEELTPGEFLRLFDDLVAACNALTIALLLFVTRNAANLTHDAVPLGATLLAMRGAGSYRSLSIERLIPTEIIQGKKQLAVVCAAPVPSKTMQTFDALHLAARAQDFGASEFDRIALTFDTGHTVSGSIFLNSSRLAEIRRNDEGAEALGEVVETSLLWHDSSSLKRRLSIALMSLRLSMAQRGEEIRHRWARQGVTPLRVRYSIRHVRNASVRGLRRVEAIVVLNWGEDPSEEDLYRIARQVVRRLRRRPVASVDIGGSGLPLRRPRYVWLKLFRRDAVLRNLENPGPNNPNLALCAEWVSLWYRARPVFVRFPTSASGGYRFEYPVRTVEENLALMQKARDGGA